MARTRLHAATVEVPLSSLPAAALRAVLREGYNAADLRRDILAGLVVGVVALPLSMALAIAVGAPPQHGLYTAIVGGSIVALLGGSRTQVTGPTAAFIVILAPIYTKFGMSGLLMSGLLAGVLLTAMGLFRLGKLIEFIPHPVTTGFTAGIGTVIATLQLKDLFGLKLTHAAPHFLEQVAAMIEANATFSVLEFALGFTTLLALIYLPRVSRRMPPAPLLALPLAAIAAWLIHHLHPSLQIATIDSRFHGIPQTPPLPILPWTAAGADGIALPFSFDTLRLLLPGAFAIAMLGAIESLLSAVVSDGMAGTRHDPDAELLALGVGNILCPFFGGIPATGAIARTATNIRSGGRSPIASVIHALTVLAAVLVLAPLIGYLPMASLAALLLLVAWNMSDAKHFVHTLKIAPRSDVAVLLTCFGLTVIFDMVIAVSVGIVLAALLFMRRMAALTETKILETGAHPHGAPGPLPHGVLVYDIDGPLFFGAATRAMDALHAIGDRAKVVILRLEDVPAIDATGLVALESALARLQKDRCLAILCGLSRQPAVALARAKIVDEADRLLIRADIVSAIETATQYIGSRK